METPDGFVHVHSGKVRDLFRTSDGRLVMVASDRVSAFDHILEPGIPDKGRILTAMSLWWFDQFDVPNHVLSADDPILPSQWRGRATVCTELDMLPIEAVARGYLAGSGTRDYEATGAVCGVALPGGLVEGSRLPQPIFTPATKAPIGEHDENIDYDTMVAAVGARTAAEVKALTVRVYGAAAEIAAARGIILADTKFEFGRDAAGTLVLGDEVLTPDSSRFWPADRWAPGGPQPSFDKQFVRDWLLSPAAGWDRDGGTPPPPLPDDVVAATRARYVEAYERLTGNAFGP